MALPALKRTQIRSAAEAVVKTIQAGATYHTSLGSNVFVWRSPTNKFQRSELPGCNIEDDVTDVDQELTGGTAGRNLWFKKLTLILSIACHDIATYDKCVADVYAAFEANYTLGGLAVDVNSAGDKIEVDQEEKKFLGGKVSLIITYETNRMEI